MGLNLSNRQIARELGLNASDVQAMTEQLRRGLVAKAPEVRLEGEVEVDEVYVVAGHKGQPAAVAKRGGLGVVAGGPGRRAGARWRRTVGSSGRRKTAYVGCSEELVQSLGRGSPAQGLSRPAVEGDHHSGELLGAVHAEVGALWKVLPQQPVGVLVRATLPRAVRIAEVDRHASLDPELGVLGHFRSLIPGQRSSQLFG